ncbi:MAG: hypothetical protein OXL97_08900 [Chloroflexota bacterium]|nr:hypothetical protein [Chloroflexota bacterium]MDE2885451.1 hypothetical protein [Chloroflexota bacterium]
MDFILRVLFVKGRTHEDQREYRFLVMSKPGHATQPQHLTASTASLDWMDSRWADLEAPVIPEQIEQAEQVSNEHNAPWKNPLAVC